MTAMEQHGAATAKDPSACVVTLAMGNGAGPSKTFVLRIGDVLRVGRGPANDFVLALGGISTCHAELFLRLSETPGTATPGLYVRDTSKNGTGVRSLTEVAASTPTKWRPLPRGGLERLESGSELLLPIRGMPREAAELAHTLTVSIAVPEGVADKARSAADALLTGEAVKAKTPRRKTRDKPEKKEKKERRQKAKEDEEVVPTLARRTPALVGHAPSELLAAQQKVSEEREAKKHGRKRRKHRRSDADGEERASKETRRRRRERE